MAIIYKVASKEDAAGLLLHISLVGGETDFLSFGKNAFNISEEREAKFIERFRTAKNDVMLVALDGDKVVGNAVLEAERIPRYSHRATLSVTVLKEYWGRGIGTELIKRLIEFAKSTSLSVVSLEVRADNSRAITLYEKFGFKKIGVYEQYFKIGERFFDAILMQLLI